MPYKQKEGPNKALIVVAIIIVCLLLSFLGVILYSVYKQNAAVTEVQAVDLTPRIIVPEGHFQTTALTKNSANKDVKSLTIMPLVDFYTDDNATEDKISKEIDAIIDSALKMEFNTITLGVNRNEQVIYSSIRLETTGIDALKMFIDKASEYGLNVDVVFSLTGYNTIMKVNVEEYISPTNNETVTLAIEELVKSYNFNNLMLTNYYIDNNGSAYKQFLAYADADDYDAWLLERADQTFDNIIAKAKATRSDIPVGIYITDTWANHENNERGSQTFSEFEALTDGYVDTKSLIESKKVDFANVLIDTSRVDTVEPFKTVADYWGTICKQSSIPMYVTHAGENAANSSLTGWNGTDELSRQVSEAVKSGNYYGSSFTGVSRLDQNVGGSTDYLVKYLRDEIAEDELYSDLEITPSQTSFVTYEEEQQFRMQFDPNAEVKLNGEVVVPSERGGASVWIPLNVGFNKITLEHKGQIKTYTIERKVIILDSVSPKAEMTVPGNSNVYVDVVAYKDSKITASLNGATITLTDMGVISDAGADSAYRNYQGSFSVPASTAKDVSIGSISFRGEYQGYVETASGSSIIVAKLPDEVDPDELTGQVLQHAVITSTYANTYAYKLPTTYANGIYYQLPRGTEDIVVSTSGDYLNLRSGKTIHSSTASLTTKEFVGNNSITRMNIGVSNNDTVISMDMKWQSPFSIDLSPYPSQELSTGKIDYQFAGNKVILTMPYVTTIGDDAIMGSVADSSLFSAMTYEKIRNEELNINLMQFTFTLAQAGKYYGCHSSWSGNTLTLKFNQAPTSSGSLTGLTIVVDPGHGGTDPGTTAGRDILEKDAALNMSFALRDALQAKGATVLMTRTTDATLSLTERTAYAHANNADMFLSVHYNSAGSNSTPSGPQMYFNAPFSQPLAQAMQTQVNQITPDYGWSYWQFQNFLVAREKQFPSVLIEVGFLSNATDEANALNSAYLQSFANQVSQGVVNYYS